MTDGYKNGLRGEFRGDFSRSTFQREKRYSSVRLQQGRVQLDADWNEQVDIQTDRDRTTTYDAVGPRGAPLHDAGFGVTVEGNAIKIGAGRIYADGIPCENDAETDFTEQQDLPDATLPTAEGRYLAYLDVWQRHITALEDPSLREVALGGPDTATRTRTVWQVKLKEIGDTNTCANFGEGWEPEEASSTGELRARAELAEDANDICAVPPGAGYTRLENQLYRVEIHDGGEAYGEDQTRSPELVSEVDTITPADNEVEVANDGRVWKVDQWVELFSEGSTAPGTLARITAVDASGRTLTLSEAISSIGAPRLRRVATFKFSRNNGSVVSRMEEITGDYVTVSDPGKDPVLRFEGGQWVELSDEGRALRGEPGVLVRLGPVTGNDLEVIWPNDEPLTMPDDFSDGATVRRWDGKDGPMPVTTGAWLDLEDGVQVEFEAGTYRTGDYWQIPARTLTSDVEWPQGPPDPQGETAAFEKRHGIEHHYCPLATLELTGTSWELLGDCRRLFPPLTQLTSLHYVSGDGQEAMPDGVLPRRLQVRVLNGGQPVVGASVEFRITPITGGGGIVQVDGASGTVSGLAVTTQSDTDGMAECVWKLDASTQSQQVEAFLLDAADGRISLPIRFNANLSVAEQVSYTPPDVCPPLAGTATVKEALDALCEREGGGCCSVTVGEGGRYETLRQAFEDLKDRPDICICMLPGDYEVVGELLVGGHRSVEISGCALGVRLFIREPMEVSSVAHFGLEKVEIVAKDPFQQPIVFTGCGEVRIGSCRITGIVPNDGALITIGGSDRIHLEDNRIQALPLELEQPLNLPLEVFGQVDGRIASLFEILNRLEFEDAASQASRELSGLSTGERRELAAAVREIAASVLGGSDPTAEERDSYERFARALELEQERGWLLERLLERLFGIREAAAPLSLQTAIVMEDARCDVLLENNDVSGVISLYGPPGETFPNVDHLGRLGPMLKRGSVAFLQTSGALRLLNNRVTRLRVAEEVAKRIIEISLGDGGEIGPVHGKVFLTDNVILSGRNLLLGHHLSVSSNTFDSSNERGATEAAGAVIGGSAVYVGNFAPTPRITLDNVSRANQKAANLLLNIIDR